MYRSPIRLAGLGAGSSFDKQTLSLARKKMLAELELGDGHTIVVAGAELNRQDIARLFDELGNEQQLAWHMAIFNDPALLHFLEKGELSAEAPGWAPNDLYDTPGFRNFVSPYFAMAMSVMYQKVLSGAAGSMLGRFMRQRSFLSPVDHETAYARLIRYFLEIKSHILLCLHRLENPENAAIDESGHGHQPAAQATQVQVTKEEIEALCSDHEIFVLNQMPGEFDDLRCTIVHALNDICVVCDHKGRPALAYAAISKAASVRCESLAELVRKNREVVYNKMQPRQSPPPTSGKEQPLRWIGLILFIFITIVRLANSSSCNNRSGHNVQYVYDMNETSSTPASKAALGSENYHRLVSILYGLKNDTLLTRHSDELPVQLVYKEKNGIDVLAPLWEKLDLSPAANIPAYDNRFATVTIRNKSSWPAIVLYVLNDVFYGSVYVGPHSQYVLRYNAMDIYADIYSGRNWSDEKKSSMLVRTGGMAMRPVKFSGGFDETSGFIHQGDNSFFYRSKESQQKFSDVLLIKDDKETGTTFSQQRDGESENGNGT